MNKDIYLSNSLGGKKEKFIPIDDKKIGMYVCGPTVYDDPHIGNARPLVIFDLLFRLSKCETDFTIFIHCFKFGLFKP